MKIHTAPPRAPQAAVVSFYSVPKLVAVLVVIPVVSVYTFIQAMRLLPPVGEVPLYGLILLLLLITFAITLAVMLRWGIVPAAVTVTGAGLHIVLQISSPLYGITSASVPFPCISNLEEGISGSTWYLSVRLNKMFGGFRLSPRGSGETFQLLLTEINAAVLHFNTDAAAHGNAVITHDPWYSSPTARLLAWALLVVLVAVPLLPLISNYNGPFRYHKILQLYVIGIPFIARVLARGVTK